jgi:hypothetical protein
MGGEMLHQHFAEAGAAEFRADEHALELAVFAADQLDAAATGGTAVGAQHEERHRLGDQSLDTEPVAALGWIERLQMRLQLVDQEQGVGSIGALGGDDGWHGRSLSFSGMR